MRVPKTYVKNGYSAWFDIAQGQLTSGELDLELVEGDVPQVGQRGHDTRRLNTKVYGERLEADCRLDLNEPSRGGILDPLDVLPTSRASSVVARGVRRRQCSKDRPWDAELAEPWPKRRWDKLDVARRPMTAAGALV